MSIAPTSRSPRWIPTTASAPTPVAASQARPSGDTGSASIGPTTTLPRCSMRANTGRRRWPRTATWSRIPGSRPCAASIVVRSSSKRRITPNSALEAEQSTSTAACAISARDRAVPVAVASDPSVASSRSSRYDAVMSRFMLSTPVTVPWSSASRLSADSTTTSRPTSRPIVGRSITRPRQAPVARAISRGSQVGTSTSPTIVASVSSTMGRPTASRAVDPVEPLGGGVPDEHPVLGVGDDDRVVGRRGETAEQGERGGLGRIGRVRRRGGVGVGHGPIVRSPAGPNASARLGPRIGRPSDRRSSTAWRCPPIDRSEGVDSTGDRPAARLRERRRLRRERPARGPRVGSPTLCLGGGGALATAIERV